KIKQTSWRQLTQHHPSLKKDVFFLTLLLIYLYRLNGQENFSIGYNIHSPMPDNSLSAHQLPLNVEFKDHLSFELCLKQIQAQLLEFFNKKTFSKDVYCRYPSLAQTPGLLSLSITLIENIADYDFNHANHLIFVIETSKSTFHLFVNKSLQITSNLATVLRNSSGHLKNLNAQLAAHYNQSISKLTILTKKESNKILKEWIKTDTDFCQNKGVHQLFEEQVSKTPNKKAITFENSSLSFLELNQKSNQLAHYLRSKGVKRQHIVAICLPRGLNLVISLLGVLKAGAAYVPLDPEYPDERIQFIINDSEAKLIITHSNNKSAPLFAPKTTVIIDQEWPLIKEKSIDNLITENQPNDLIYLIYTSGSTGKPKGVLVEHKGVVNCLISIAQKIKINANDKFLAVTPLSFDVAALDYYLPFAFGASTIIASDKDRKNGEALIHLLCSAGITAMQATPTTWQMLIIGQWEGAKQFKILTAGEALSKNLSNSLQQRGLLFNIYGPTETTIYATFAQIKKNSPLSIGKPIANTKAFVLNNSKIPQPIGVRGELYISGIGVTRGYLHHEEGTKNNFINKLSVGNDTIRAYKTGDLVRWLPDGNLEYINRIDHQIKIRGYRIELGEIEHRLLDCPDIRQAVVLPYENKEHKQLVAYIVRNDNLQALNKEQLKKQLAQQLPE
ncbi:MAG: amino acid adenylation domain-containing protein, partial [Gammaproteobacteria bacterium]|nr:amino acid adenylation domain-containing protein [Gammaproteobacteria bacterium]